jgi:hypothetical protein
MTCLDVIAEARQMGLTLWAKDNGKLGFRPGRLCPPEFKEKLAANKAQLLALLRAQGITWIEVYSERIGETLFFCEDDATRAALIKAGADEWQIYTKAELRTLIAQNRVAPFTDAELRKLHEIKRTFNARITQ